MAITPQILEERRSYLGSSDIAAILGLNPWMDELDVLASKRPDLVKPRDQGDMRRADFGTRMEPVLRSWLADELGRPVVECETTCRHAKVGCVGANPDAYVEGDGEREIAELKCSYLTDGWGEPGTGDIPKTVFAQCQWQLACAPDIRNAHVVKLGTGRNWVPERYMVRRDDETIGVMVEVGERWWRDHVVGGKLPTVNIDKPHILDAVERIVRKPGAVATLSPALVSAWSETRAARIAAEKAEDAAKSQILLALGDARIGEVPGYGIWEYALESAGARVDSKKLKELHPSVYAQVASDGTRNMPRWRPIKGVELPAAEKRA